MDLEIDTELLGGLKWDKSSISVILRNSAYIGKGFYNKKAKGKVEDRVNGPTNPLLPAPARSSGGRDFMDSGNGLGRPRGGASFVDPNQSLYGPVA